MKINKMLFKGVFVLSALLVIGALGQKTTFNAAGSGYRALPITGTQKVNLTFDTSDMVGTYKYSGTYKYRAWVEDGSGISGTWDNLKYKNGTIVSVGVNNPNADTFYVKDFELKNKEGEQKVCLEIMDYAVHSQSNGKGNISARQCNTIYFDKSAPVIDLDTFILNEGNRFINHGNVPGRFVITDNRAGIGSISYKDGYGGIRQIPAGDIVCKKSTNPVNGDGSVRCNVNTTFQLNSDTAYNELELNVCDKVGNCSGFQKTKTIWFDKVKPTIDLKIPNASSGLSVNTNEVVVEYHVKDDVVDPWIYPSGIQKIVLSNNGYNEVLIMINTDLTKDMEATVDGMIRDYVMHACPGTVTMEVWDRAGNYNIKNENVDSCSDFLIENLTMNNVINPNKYNASNPFPSTDYMPTGGMSPLPQALAGANINFTVTYKWDGDEDIHDMYGKYIITVKNEDGSYNKSFSKDIVLSDFVDMGSDIYTTTHEVKLPTDAPKSVTGNNTYVYIEVVASIETLEDDVIKTGSDTFPDIGNGIMATIVGSIEDYLWFGETN